MNAGKRYQMQEVEKKIRVDVPCPTHRSTCGLIEQPKFLVASPSVGERDQDLYVESAEFAIRRFRRSGSNAMTFVRT